MKVIPRARWKAGPNQAALTTIDRSEDFLHHTVGGAPWTKWGERKEMRNLQAVARSRGFVDISYSWIVFPSGRIYEGRGKNREGAHTIGHNDSYAIAAAGNYDEAVPTRKMLKAIHWLRHEYLRVGGRPLPHSSVYATACPGKYLRAKVNEL